MNNDDNVQLIRSTYRYTWDTI